MRRRTNIYLDEQQLDALRERGLDQHRSVADLVRQAVDNSLTTPATRAATTVVAAAGVLPAGDFPSDGSGWSRRPYFLQEAQVSWADFVGLLHSEDGERRRWALARLLDGARWDDIWRLISVDQLARDLPHLRFRGRDFWARIVDPPA